MAGAGAESEGGDRVVVRQRASGRPQDLRELRRPVLRDLLVVVLALVVLGVLSVRRDLPRELVDWSQHHRRLPLDQLVFLLAAAHPLMVVFGARRARQLKDEHASRRSAQHQLLHQAHHDGLTGLLNRTAFVEAVEVAAQQDGCTAVVLIDLDRFKEVNDTLGHHVGDALLQAVARRLLEHLDAGATLARLGGDEFAVLLPGCDVERSTRVADQLLQAATQHFDAAGLVLEVDASMGIAVGPGHGRTAADLLRHADVAMYAAKAEHAGAVVYSPALDEHGPERLQLYGDLRRAIHTGELVVHYQPKVALADGRVLGVEALVRWQHPDRGLLLPGDFIDVAEQTGLIRPLTDAVLRQTLADCRAWREGGLPLTVAVNLSVRNLLDASLPQRVAELLHEHALPPDCLELEVTESAAMQDPGRALRVLHALRALGLSLSVDDYGTGHASLAHLSRLPVDALKIDQSFVTTMATDDSHRTIVRSTIDLAHSLGFRVVAEGVESREAWRELDALGCDQAQGFWLGRPVSAGAVASQLAEIERQLGEDQTRPAASR